MIFAIIAFLKVFRSCRGKSRVSWCLAERSGIAGSFIASNESNVLGMDFIAVPIAFLCRIACSVGDVFSDESETIGAGLGSTTVVSFKILGSCVSKNLLPLLLLPLSQIDQR